MAVPRTSGCGSCAARRSPSRAADRDGAKPPLTIPRTWTASCRTAQKESVSALRATTGRIRAESSIVTSARVPGCGQQDWRLPLPARSIPQSVFVHASSFSSQLPLSKITIRGRVGAGNAKTVSRVLIVTRCVDTPPDSVISMSTGARNMPVKLSRFCVCVTWSRSVPVVSCTLRKPQTADSRPCTSTDRKTSTDSDPLPPQWQLSNRSFQRTRTGVW